MRREAHDMVASGSQFCESDIGHQDTEVTSHWSRRAQVSSESD